MPWASCRRFKASQRSRAWDIRLRRYYQAYIDLFAWLEKENYKIAGDPRAVYIDGIWNQEDSDKWLTIIQVPVETN